MWFTLLSSFFPFQAVLKAADVQWHTITSSDNDNETSVQRFKNCVLTCCLKNYQVTVTALLRSSRICTGNNRRGKKRFRMCSYLFARKQNVTECKCI